MSALCRGLHINWIFICTHVHDCAIIHGTLQHTGTGNPLTAAINKPARLSTGIEIQVPEYISNDEKVWVSTLTGEFAGRA